MISLDKCIRSCNVLSPKVCVPKVTKYINFKAFNMITNKNEAKTKRISCECKWKFNSTQHVIQIKNRIIKHVNLTVKIIISAKTIIAGILVNVFVRVANI